MINNEIELIETVNSLINEKKNKEALELLNSNISLIEKKYYDIIRLKIELELKLDKNIDALIDIKEELKVPYVPKDFEDFLYKSKKEVDYRLKDNERKSFDYEDIENIDKLDENALTSVISKLNKFNLKGYESVFQNIFDNKSYSDFVKSLLIFTLQDAKLNHEFVVIKDKQKLTFNPSLMENYNDNFAYNYLNKKLSYVKDVPINIANQALQLALTYVFFVYPLNIDKETSDLIACASLVYGMSLINEDLENGEYKEFYLKNKEVVDDFINKISKMY